MAPLTNATGATIHKIGDLSKATTDDLCRIIQTFPLIDNHAHNILIQDQAYGSPEYPFESVTSEAHGPALFEHVHSTLSHMRAIKQLSEFYNCSETLNDVRAARSEWVRRDYPGLIRKCLEGTQAIMIDDGLFNEIVYPYKWHREFVPEVSRIVRIEAVAAEILQELVLAAGLAKPTSDAEWVRDQTEALFIRFNGEFRNQIRAFANDPDVRGFKSIICYRTGLDVELHSRKVLRPPQTLTDSDLLSSFTEYLHESIRKNNYRIQKKAFNDYLVVAVCEVLDKRVEAEGEGLPFQFHTGLGDPDLSLVKANPAYMQPLIEEFPNVDFVILHSSYPYTREAGYLAANYSNAWLDMGEVFPMLSRDGQESILKQALELTPASKLLWSTDGHFFPETYWLGNKQIRYALEKVLVEGVAAGDYSPTQAVNIAVDFLFWNSNSLYRLGLDRKYPHLWDACGRKLADSSTSSMTNGTYKGASVKSKSKGSEMSSTPSAVSLPIRSQETNTAKSEFNSSTSGDIKLLDAFMEKNPSTKYIWLQWLDYTATMRMRMVTVKQFRKQLTTGSKQSVTNALLHLLQNDFLASGGSTSGKFFTVPDLSTLALNKGISSPSATVQQWWMADTPDSSTHHECCPRWTLQKQVHMLKSEYNITMLMGFEIEIIFMRPVYDPVTAMHTDFQPLHTNHSYCNMTYQQVEILPMIEEIVATLAEIDIHLPVFHSEAAPGQWEFPTPAFEPLKAIDVLYKTRSVIQNVAKNHGLKATLYPRPYNFACGSASHSHFSINGEGDTVAKYADPFLAGILAHLPSILAFTLPLEESYERVKAGIWAGGEWITWGTENKEVPLRKVDEGHWEMKTVDGIGNMYLSMAALVASGLDGLREEMELKHKDNEFNASLISEEQRLSLGIDTQLPNTLPKSLDALRKDKVLADALGHTLVNTYISVKEGEMKILGNFDKEKRRVWLLERY